MNPRSARPTYEQIADAINGCLGAGLYQLILLQDGKLVENPTVRLARILERNGLIDARGTRRP